MTEQPIAKFRAGQVSCALWENLVDVKGRPMTILKATVERRFKNKSGHWQSSNSYSRNELPLAIWCLQRAFDEIIRRQNESSGETTKEETIE